MLKIAVQNLNCQMKNVQQLKELTFVFHHCGSMRRHL